MKSQIVLTANQYIIEDLKTLGNIPASPNGAIDSILQDFSLTVMHKCTGLIQEMRTNVPIIQPQYAHETFKLASCLCPPYPTFPYQIPL